MKISLAPGAQRELIEGGLFYAREGNAELAEKFLSEFERAATVLGEFPQLGAVWRGRIRRFPLRRFPYSIVYYLRESEVRVLSIAHQSRKPGFWKDRK